MNIEPEILAKCPLFMQIEPQSYSALLSCVNASEKTFSTNESIFLAGSQINYVGIVVKGSLSIIKESPAGQKHIIDFVGPSNLFGEGVVCTENRISPITVFAKENGGDDAARGAPTFRAQVFEKPASLARSAI